MNYKIGGFRFGKIKPLILYKWFYLCITSEKKQIVIFKQRGGETMSTTKALLKENVWYVMFAIVFALVLILPGMVSAKVGDTCTATTVEADCGFGESCSADGKCIANFGVEQIQSGLGGSLGNKSLIATITSVINVALGLLGVIAVVIILIGGFKWMTAGGNEDKVAEARKLIFAGIIGLAIILAAWAIAKFVITSLSQATGSGNVL